MQRIIVKSIVTKPTKKEGTNITTIEDEKGAKMSAFNDSALEKVHAGDVLEVEVAVEGKYTNITGWKLIESKPVPVPPTPVPQPPTSAPYLAELDGRFRNTALMQAIETAKRLPVGANAKEEVGRVTALADYYYAWLKGEKPVEKPVVKESVQSTAATPALPVVESPYPIWAEIGELMKAANWKEVTLKSWVKNQFKADTTGTVNEVLSRLNPNDFYILHNHLKSIKGIPK